MPNREQRRASKEDATVPKVRITVDGETYVLDRGEVDYQAELDLFNASKLTMNGVFSAMEGGDFAPFMVAALVFLARRSAGETDVRFREIAEHISYASEVDAEVLTDEDADALPEGRAAD